MIDDKYHTPESQKFKDSVALGPYKHHNNVDQYYELGKINFYLNSYPRSKYGEKVPDCHVAFRSQIHRYGFICEESDESSSLVKRMKDSVQNYIKLPLEVAKYGTGYIPYGPVFSLDAEVLQAGPHTFIFIASLVSGRNVM